MKFLGVLMLLMALIMFLIGSVYGLAPLIVGLAIFSEDIPNTNQH